jgi:IMP dehydrogenase/GMP reductase
MAGNVATPEMVQELILEGVDIVKVGIGPGCFKAGTRILMGNGYYKNIEDIQPGEYVINMYGQPVCVKRSFSSGRKPVIELNSVGFYKPTLATRDHCYFVGDLSTTSKSTVSARGYSEILTLPTRLGVSKLRWLPIEDAERAVLLAPTNIQYQFATPFQLLCGGQTITPSQELGYLISTFLGVGHARKDDTRRKPHYSAAYSGSVRWFFGLDEIKIANKVKKYLEDIFQQPVRIKTCQNMRIVECTILKVAEFFMQFGKRQAKVLPTYFFVDNRDYLHGLHEGLVDSDGGWDSGRMAFTNTSLYLIELFGVLTQILYGTFPEYQYRPPSAGGLDADVNNCKPSYKLRKNITSEKRVLVDEGFQCIKYRHKNWLVDNNETCEVFDLEVDCPTHSFIADNCIVHNSHCKTRLVTGVGYPQLSAVLECADAAHGLGGLVCADGGCRTPGDIAKAFGAGADFVMLGGMLAGTQECEGEWTEAGLKVYGMSSQEAQDKYSGGVPEYATSEGRCSIVPAKGPVSNILSEMTGGLRSACSYVGARGLKDFSKCCSFVRVR